jgi:hypothetical protein
MSRNNERVLSDMMISDIKSKMFDDLDTSYNYLIHSSHDAKCVMIDAIMDAYLTDDFESFKQLMTEIIEGHESDILLTLNMELNEDSNVNN